MKQLTIQQLKEKIISHPIVESFVERSKNDFVCKLNIRLGHGDGTNSFYLRTFKGVKSCDLRTQLIGLYNNLETSWFNNFARSLKRTKAIPEFLREELSNLNKDSNNYKVIQYLISQILDRDEEIDSIR